MRPFLLITFEILHKSGSRELPVGKFSALVLRSDENQNRFSSFLRVVHIGEYHHVKELGSTFDPSGVSRIRTGDPRYAKPMLYHLSYNPSHLRTVLGLRGGAGRS